MIHHIHNLEHQGMKALTDDCAGDLKKPSGNEKQIQKMGDSIKKISGLVLGVMYFIPSVFVYCSNVRFIIVSNPRRIGHLAVEIDCFLKEILLKERPRVRAVLLLSSRKAANDCLLQYWASRVLVVRNTVLRKLLAPLSRFPYLRISLAPSIYAMEETASYPSVLARWGSRQPLLTLSESHRARGEVVLRAMGVPSGAWFVCLHSREGGYSPHDEQYHAHRNSDIGSYRLAMEAIVERGGWCIRVGDSTMAPMEPMHGAVDYAKSDHKSDWMDIFLFARCRFFLGNTSGPCVVSTVFGIPAALANLTPFSSAYPVGVSDLGIPMLVKTSAGETLCFADVLDAPFANFRIAERYRQNGLVLEKNSPEEIRELANEMMDRLDGTATNAETDECLQDAFRSLFRDGHYTYGAASRIGRDFLRKYSHLLPDQSAPSQDARLNTDL